MEDLLTKQKFASPTTDSPAVSLCDALDRILTKGVVAHGDLVLSVAGVDLLYINVRGLIAAADVVGINGQGTADSAASPEQHHG